MVGTTSGARALAACLLLIVSANAVAATIPGFGLQDSPQFVLGSLLVAYDSDDEMLTAMSISGGYDGDGSGQLDTITGTGFQVQVGVDSEGTPGAGQVTLNGTVDSMGWTSGSLLTGNVVDFGVDQTEGSTTSLQILFEITGGDAAYMFGPMGAISITGSDFPGDWKADWANSAGGEAIAAPPAVPLPGAAWLMLGALGALTRLRRTN